MSDLDVDLLRETLADPKKKDAWDDIADRLSGNPLDVLGDLIPRAVIDPTDPTAVKPDPVILARLQNAADVLVVLARTPDAKLDESQSEDLRLLKHLVGRPALAVSKGRYATAPPQWAFLDEKRITPRLAAVGRIDAPEGKQVGTGFLVNTSVIMTNRHVVKQLRGGGVVIPPHAMIDFDADAQGKRPTARIVRELWVSTIEQVDLALLEVDGVGLPPPLVIQRLPPPAVEDRLVYAIGYPGADNDGDTPESVLRAVFAGALGIKRMQPGKIRGYDTIDRRRVVHDCSTLGGSSGSCVVDYASGTVYGLHYCGLYKKRNRAVALWTVADDENIAPHLPKVT